MEVLVLIPKDVKKRAHRTILSKIRKSNHRLAIETVRFSKTPRNEKNHLYCTADNVSEKDNDLLLRCSRFSEIRIALFDHERKSCPRIDKLNDEKTFIYLLNSSCWTLFIQILLLFNIMLNDISFFVFMLNMFLKLFCECLV